MGRGHRGSARSEGDRGRRSGSGHRKGSPHASTRHTAAHTLVRFAIAVVLLLAACTPATTRPPFAPFPEALHVVINARPAEVTRQADSILRADTIPIAF